MTVREKTEEIQKKTLSPYAFLVQNTKGRRRSGSLCPIRTEFARDRDRIIHCKAFRRLTHKTQVFLSPAGDHYRTRLTHTLEVSQIARTLATALGLNQELTEAIALGHDLGHTPFGHAGERALSRLHAEKFSHAAQSVRIVQVLENDGQGLNLTYEVVNGIACHSYSNPAGRAETLEGQVVYYADKIAYLNHDLEDALRGGVITNQDIPWEVQMVLGRNKSARITAMILSIVNNSHGEIVMGKEEEEAFHLFHRFMYEAVYKNPKAKSEEIKAEMVVERLFQHYCKHPQEMPELYRRQGEIHSVERGVCDYISGMSDRFAVNTYQNLFIPQFWSIG